MNNRHFVLKTDSVSFLTQQNSIKSKSNNQSPLAYNSVAQTAAVTAKNSPQRSGSKDKSKGDKKSYRALYERWKKKSGKASKVFSMAKSSISGQTADEILQNIEQLRSKGVNSRCSNTSNISKNRTSQLSLESNKPGKIKII